MSFTDSTIISYKTNAGTVSQSTVNETGATRQSLTPTIAAGATNVHFALPVDASAVISLLMYSSKDITLKTNSSSLPAQTFQLKAGIGLTWNGNNTEDNPLTTDVTDLYFTNTGTEDAAVQLCFLIGS